MSRFEPTPIALKLHTQHFIMHPQITVRAAFNRLRHYLLYVLRNHTDIGLAAAVIDEAVEAKTIIEAADQHDVVLKSDVRPSSTATPPTSAAAMTAAAGAMTSASAADAPAATMSA